MLLQIEMLIIPCEIALKWIPRGFSENMSALVTSHYLKQCCLSSISPFGVTRPQSQRTHDAKITSLWRQNNVATSFWRHNDVIIASCARWDELGCASLQALWCKKHSRVVRGCWFDRSKIRLNNRKLLVARNLFTRYVLIALHQYVRIGTLHSSHNDIVRQRKCIHGIRAC